MPINRPEAMDGGVHRASSVPDMNVIRTGRYSIAVGSSHAI